jgi:hypothetical protein
LPLIFEVPPVSSNSPHIARSRLDLPHPTGPMTPTKLPLGIWNVKLLMMSAGSSKKISERF